MTTQRIAWLLLLGLIVLETAPAYAQRSPFDRFRRRPSRSATERPPRETVNRNHENAKSNAERASQQGNPQRAVELTTNVLLENPQDHVAYYIRAGARVELGMRKQDGKLVRDGVADARQAIRLKRTDNVLYYLPYLYGMSRLTELEGNPEHAKVSVTVAGQVLELAQLSNSEKANIYYQRAFARGKLGEHASAAADYHEAVLLEPKHFGALLGRAAAYAAADNREQALSSFDRAVEALPQQPQVYNERGMYRAQTGDLQGAISDYDQTTRLDPKFLWAYTNRGVAKLETGDPVAAEVDFSQSLQRRPDQSVVHVLRGSARLTQGKSAGALADFRKALELDPAAADAHASLGFAQYFTKDFAGAQASFDKAQSLNAAMHHLNPWKYLTLLHLGQSEAAANLVAERSDASASEPEWSDELLTFLAGSMEGAALLGKADAGEPELAKSQPCEAYYFIAERNALDGNAEGAQQNYRQALETKAYHLSAYRGAQFALQQFVTGNRGQAGLAPRN